MQEVYYQPIAKNYTPLIAICTTSVLTYTDAANFKTPLITCSALALHYLCHHFENSNANSKDM
jgi:hypothetical protein